MHWFLLIVAGLLEVCWLIALKYSEGFTRLVPSVLMIVGLGLSMFFLAVSIRTIPVGTAYAIWTGIGAVGGVLAGIFLFGESRDALRLFFICLIVCGIVGLKLVSK